jgi:hypothetical protein
MAALLLLCALQHDAAALLLQPPLHLPLQLLLTVQPARQRKTGASYQQYRP